jgi:hypothetical protein
VADAILLPAFLKLYELEQQVKVEHPELRCYPFQPRKRPTENCLWNWILPDEGSAEWVGTGPSHRDEIVVRATIAVQESADPQEQMMRLLRYTDSFLNVIDPGLNPQMNPMPLGDCVRRAKRLGMSTGLHPFGVNEPPLLGMDFPIELQLDRNSFA